MFTLTQSVENATGGEVRLQPYGTIARHGMPSDLKNFYILHEGAIRMADGELQELKYKAMADLPVVPAEGAPAEVRGRRASDGWIGITDHYWMTSLTPPSGQAFTAVVKYTPATDVYQTDARLPVVAVPAGGSSEVTTGLFAGAKVWSILRDYQDEKPILGFVDAIDWGWFFFLTKPIFRVLHEMHKLIGNMGLAIIGLTLVIKLLLFPLAYKSYVSMSKMKALQPQMEKIKETAGDDRMKMQQEVMALYKREKVNPAAGCLPIILQIPIFFSLYKVIFVTIELRHAPFFGWIKDLSAPDPDLDPQPLRAAALGGAVGDELHRHPVDRGVADPARHLDVAAAEAEPDAHRQDPGDDLHLDAVGVHVHARPLRQRAGDLLGGEQHHHLRPAVHDHAHPGGAAERARQHPRSAEAVPEGGLRCRPASARSRLWRHPIKGHGVEAVAAVTLAAGATMPWDRVWAIAHEAARVAPGSHDWVPCANFSRGAKSFELMAIRAEVDEAAGRVTLSHPRRGADHRRSRRCRGRRPADRLGDAAFQPRTARGRPSWCVRTGG